MKWRMGIIEREKKEDEMKNKNKKWMKRKDEKKEWNEE